MAVKIHSKSANAKKKLARVRRAKSTRQHIKSLQVKSSDLLRLSVKRSSKNISAQLIKYEALEGKSLVVASASTLEKTLKTQCKYTGNIDAAKVVGKAVAQRALEKGFNKIAFDRSGYKYHGRVKALADAAREAGLEF